jgi:hypothetical protein
MGRRHMDIDMEEDTFDLSEYNAELDEMVGSVMPDSWVGHARVKIHERGFTGKKRNFAVELTKRLLDKNPGLSAQVAAEKAIEQTEEKL